MNTPEELQKQTVEIARRNEAIAELMGFKTYIPNDKVAKSHREKYQAPMRWFFIPAVGRYNSFELKFDKDYNWLMSAVITLKKYEHSHKPDSKLERIFRLILNIKLIDINKEKLWILVSDYSQELLNQKVKDKK